MILRLSQVARRFPNGTQALADLSFDIAQGSFVSLLGPSGCGKSTALRLVAGLLTPDSGEIAWSGASASKSAAAARKHNDVRGFASGRATQQNKPELGFVFQEPTLMPWANVFDNVRLPLRLQGRGRAAARSDVEAALAMVGLAGFAAAYPRELSGGMRMRVSIARALVTRPKLLLMDEPFAALDEITRLRLNDDLLRLWQQQRWTVVFVTHSVYESVYLSTRVAVMAARPGRVIADLPIAAPYPRDEAFRTSPAYNAFCREVSAELRRAMGEAA